MRRRPGAAGFTILGATLLLIGLLGAPIIGIYQLPSIPLKTTSLSTASPSSPGYFKHTAIIVMENEGIQDICGQNPPPCLATKAAYMAALANNYTIAQQYTSVNTPLTSGPNYVALVGGSTFTCTSGGCGTLGGVTARNVPDLLDAAGLSWKAYFENLPGASGCFGQSQGVYNNIHNPFIWFSDIYGTSRCNQIVLANPAANCATDPVTLYPADCQIVSDLNGPSPPSLSFIVPNDCDNMHGNSGCVNGCGTTGNCVTIGNAYLRNIVSGILSTSAFTAGQGVVFIVFDEGNGYCPLNGSSADCVYAVWAGARAKTGYSDAILYSHYSWLRTIEDNWGLAQLTTNDAAAATMTGFLLPLNPPLPPPLQSTFTFSPASPVAGAPVTFSAVGTGGVPPYAYKWNFGDGSALGTSLNTQTVMHTYQNSGIYTLTLTVIDQTAQQSVVSGQIFAAAPTPALTASFSFTPTSPQTGQTVTFTSSVTGGVAPYTVSWTFGNGDTATGSSAQTSYATAGSYTVTAQVTDSQSPPAATTAMQTVPVTQAPVTGPPSATFTITPAVGMTQAQSTFTATVTGGTFPYGYGWSISSGPTILGTGTGNPFSYTFGSAGSFTITLTVTDAANKQTTTSLSYTVNNPVTQIAPAGLPLWPFFITGGVVTVIAPSAATTRRRR